MSLRAHPVRAAVAAAASSALLLALPAAGQAATTIGQDLALVTPGKSLVCDPCTALRTVDDPSPVSGVITRWRIKSASFGQSVTLRVLRLDDPFGGTTTGIATGNPQILSLPVNTFTSRIPIKAGQMIGVNASGNPKIVQDGGLGVNILRISPTLNDGETRDPGGAVNAKGTLALNADVEPDADGDGFGDETQDGCPTDGTKQGACSGGGGGGGGGGSQGGIADLTAPQISVSFKRRLNLRRALRGGRRGALVGTVRSSEAGTVAAQADIGGRIAKRLRLQRSASRAAIVAKADATLAASSRKTVKFRFTRRAKRKLRSARRVRLTLRFTVRDQAGNPSVATRKVTLKR
jgi:hypothetical protein